MSYLLDGVDDRGIADQPITGDIPVTVAAWFKTPGNTANQAAAALIATDGSDDQSVTLFAAGAVAGDPVTFQLRTTSNLGVNSTVPPAYAVDTWQHACGVNVSSTDHRAFLNGANKGSSATAKDVTGTLTKLVVGMRGNSTSPFTGRIAEVAIWDVALSDADVALLAAGRSPMSLSTPPIRYYRLKADALDTVTGANGLTITGATLDADHPTVDDPPGAPGGVSGSMQVTGGGQVAVQGRKDALGGSVMSVGGDVSTAGAKAGSGSAQVTGGGTVTMAGSGGAVSPSGTMGVTGGGAVNVVGRKAVSGAAQVTGGGTVTLGGPLPAPALDRPLRPVRLGGGTRATPV